MKGTLTCTGSTSCSSGFRGSVLLGAVAWGVMRTRAACTSPSSTLRLSSGASCQPMRAPSTSTTMAGLLQRSQPMLPPARSDPLTSRLSSFWSAGKYCAARASARASDVLLPAHHHAPPPTASTSASRPSTSQASSRSQLRRLRGGGGGADDPALKSGERLAVAEEGGLRADINQSVRGSGGR